MLRELNELAKKLKIVNNRISYHQFRYKFAINYIRQGGDAIRLQRVLGHSTIVTTQGYVRLQTDDLRETQIRTSLLKKLKS